MFRSFPSSLVDSLFQHGGITGEELQSVDAALEDLAEMASITKLTRQKSIRQLKPRRKNVIVF